MNVKIPLGLGDAVYCYPIIKKLAERERVTVQTPYPEVFKDLDIVATADVLSSVDLHIRYNWHDLTPYYYQLCRAAGIEPPPFEMLKIPGLKSEKPYAVIKEPAAAHMLKKSGDFSLTPNPAAMQDFIDAHPQYTFFSVGKDEVYKARLKGVENVDGLSVSSLLMLCSQASFIVTGFGHLAPIAMAYDVPLHLFLPEKNEHPKLKNVNEKMVIVPGKKVYVYV